MKRQKSMMHTLISGQWFGKCLVSDKSQSLFLEISLKLTIINQNIPEKRLFAESEQKNRPPLCCAMAKNVGKKAPWSTTLRCKVDYLTLQSRLPYVAKSTTLRCKVDYLTLQAPLQDLENQWFICGKLANIIKSLKTFNILKCAREHFSAPKGDKMFSCKRLYKYTTN